MLLDEWVDEVGDARAPRGYGGVFYGAYPAVVTDVRDPDGQGKVKVSLPWSPDGQGARYEVWARLATLMGGSSRGSWFIPDVNDEVLVVFLAGDPRHPHVVGGLWNGQDAPPQQMDGAGRNYVKQICSRNGIKVTLDDHDGQETLTLETPGGQKITMADGPGVLTLQDSNGNSIRLDSSGITMTAQGTMTVNANGGHTLTAPTTMVSAGMSTFSGVVQTDTHLSNSVISASYTPGAGNIW